MRCNKCKRPMKGLTAYNGACECGGLIEATTVVTTRPFDAWGKRYPAGTTFIVTREFERSYQVVPPDGDPECTMMKFFTEETR